MQPRVKISQGAAYQMPKQCKSMTVDCYPCDRQFEEFVDTAIEQRSQNLEWRQYSVTRFRIEVMYGTSEME